MELYLFLELKASDFTTFRCFPSGALNFSLRALVVLLSSFKALIYKASSVSADSTSLFSSLVDTLFIEGASTKASFSSSFKELSSLKAFFFLK